MASTFSFLKRKPKTSMDEDLQLSLDEPNFRKEYLRGEYPCLCGQLPPGALGRVPTAAGLKANAHSPDGVVCEGLRVLGW